MTSTITSVYYNSLGGGTGLGSARSPDGLKKMETFVGWDFDNTWAMVNGEGSYPYLKNLQSGLETETEPIASQITYTGSQITPEPTVKLKSGIPLSKDVHYTLSYGENKNIGTGTVSITGIGELAGFSENLSFEIIPKTLTLSVQNKIYDGTTNATITSINGIIDGDDVSYTATANFADKNIGTAKTVSIDATLSGVQAANYVLNTASPTANITQKPLTITLNPKIISMDLTEPMPSFQDSLAYNGLVTGDALAGTTTITHTFNGFESGMYIITLSGTRTNSNYSISYDNTGLFLIVTGNIPHISNCVIPNIPAQTYTGGQIKPQVTVTCNGTLLTEFTDYRLEYETNIAANGRVTVVGINSYGGTVIKDFEILGGTTKIIRTYATGNTIILENVPTNTKVEVYNLQGKLIHSVRAENFQPLCQIPVHTKGLYIAKIGNEVVKIAVR